MANPHLTRSRWAAIGAAVAVTLGGGGLIGVTAADGTGSAFTPVPPTRILDTRSGQPVSGATIAVQVTGDLVPTGAVAATINLTVTGGVRNAGYGFVTAYPCLAATDPPPNASTINFVEGVDIANAVTVPLGSSGLMCLNVFGTAHLLVDVAGYLAPAPTVDAYTRDEVDKLITGTADDLEERISGVGTEIATLARDIAGKVSTTDLDALGELVDTKADTTDLEALEDLVDTKASAAEMEEIGTLLYLGLAEEIETAVNEMSKHLVPRPNPDGLTIAVEQDDDVGYWPAIAVGHDGIPVVVHSTLAGTIEFIKCGDQVCSSAYSATIDSDPAMALTPVDVAIDRDGNPIIAYGGPDGLVVVTCNDPMCRDGDESQHDVSETTGAVAPSIVLRPNSSPVVAFIDGQDRLRVLSCVDRACTQPTTSSPLPGEVVVSAPAMTIGASGNPVIVAGVQSTDPTPRTKLVVVTCDDAGCEGGNDTARTLHADPNLEIGNSVAVTLGTDGYPFIAYSVIDQPGTLGAAQSLYVYACGAIDCDPSVPATPPTPRAIANTTNGGSYVNLAIARDGNPVIVHVHSAFKKMEVIWCTELDCSGDLRRSTAVAQGTWPLWNDMTIGIDGVPIIAFHDFYDATLRTTRPWWMSGGRP